VLYCNRHTSQSFAEQTRNPRELIPTQDPQAATSEHIRPRKKKQHKIQIGIMPKAGQGIRPR
jgi:hypothetical protein